MLWAVKQWSGGRRRKCWSCYDETSPVPAEPLAIRTPKSRVGDGAMLKLSVGMIGGKRVVLMDSISSLEASDTGQIAVSASRGSRSAGERAAQHPPAVCFFNDGGTGKDGLGVEALGFLDSEGIAAAAYSNESARSGDAREAWEKGMISRVNASAQRLGFRAGEQVATAVRRVFGL